VNDSQDAFGHALLDELEGRSAFEVIERSDGRLDVSNPVAVYFNGYADWGPLGQKAIDLARGRVLDIGCGAGRFTLHVQGSGLDVVAIDWSPLAVEVARRRGVRDARVLSITGINGRLGPFDTVLMMGNNFGLFGNAGRAKSLLRRLWRITNPGAQIIAQTLDPYQTNDSTHLEYQASNRRKHRMGGQIRMRVRYQCRKTPWFDYLFVSVDELTDLIRGTGWVLAEVLGWNGPIYVARLERSSAHG